MNEKKNEQMKRSCHPVKCSAHEMTASKYKTNADIELNNILQKM